MVFRFRRTLIRIVQIKVFRKFGTSYRLFYSTKYNFFWFQRRTDSLPKSVFTSRFNCA